MGWVGAGSDWAYINTSTQRHVGQEVPDAEI